MVNDDAGTGPHGRIWEIDEHGRVSVIVDASRLNASTGFDIAPPGFGDHAGKIFTLSQQEFYGPGVRRNHLIQVIDPASDAPATTFCELPTHGTIGNGIAGAWLEARFGPPDTAFAGRLFSVTILNNTVCQITADGACAPFVTFDRQVWGIAFMPDESRMLATLKGGGPLMSGPGDVASDANMGAIVSVGADGAIDPTPVLAAAHRPTAVEVAPADFGAYAGQIFSRTGNLTARCLLTCHCKAKARSTGSHPMAEPTWWRRGSCVRPASRSSTARSGCRTSIAIVSTCRTAALSRSRFASPHR